MSNSIAIREAATALLKLAKNQKPRTGSACMAEWRAVQNLRVALRQWEESGEDVPTVLFTDEVHASLTLAHWGNPGETLKVDGNELYRLEGDDATVVFTGEQLDSVAKWWLQKRGIAVKGKARK